MNYRLVRQFSNSMIDNIFRFFYKIVDFGKIWVDVFWAFFDIWEAFFLIFYNLFMYVYYFVLFIIDKSTESRSTVYFWKKTPTRVPYTPSKVFMKDMANPVPAMYGRQAASVVTQAASSVGTLAQKAVASSASRLGAPASGARGSVVKKILEFLSNLFGGVADVIMAPVGKIQEMLSRKMKPVKEDHVQPRGSLIDEYLKEYEQRKKV